MVIKQCICGGGYHKGKYYFHINSWVHKLYKVLKRRATDEEVLRFQNNFVDEPDLIDDRSSTTSTTIPEDKMTDYDSN